MEYISHLLHENASTLKTNLKTNEASLISRIIACAIQVHSQLGNGFQKEMYRRALAIELSAMNLCYVCEMDMPVFYEQQQIGSRCVDLLVENAIMVELRAVFQLLDIHLLQAINYLEAGEMQAGLLINFGGKNLQYKSICRL